MPGPSVRIPMIGQRTETPLMGVDSGVIATTKTGEALQQLGSTALAVSEEYQHRANQAAVKQADTYRKKAETDILWGEDGLFSKSGEDFLNELPKAREKLAKARDEAGANLQNGVQRSLYGQVADDGAVDLDRQLGAYQQRAQRQYLSDVSVGRQSQAEQDFERLYGVDPDGANKAWATVRSEIVGRADINGEPPELTTAAINKAQSEALQRVITAQYVGDPLNGPAKARATLEKERANMDPLVVADLDQKIRGAETQVEAQGLVNLFNGDGSVPSSIRSAASAAGVDGDTALTIAMLENPGLNPSAKNPKSSAQGLFQILDGTWDGLGGGDRSSVDKQIENGIKNLAQTQDALRKGLGRAPLPWEVYLGHQQGAGGALKLLQNPNAKAVDILGRDEVINNGGRADMSAKEFAALWQQKYGRTAAAAAKVGGSAGAPDLGTRIEIAKALAGGDPDRVKTFVGQVTSDYEMTDRVQREAEQARVEQVWTYAEKATSESQIPQDLWQAITPEHRDAFRSHIKSNASGVHAVTDPAVYANLAGLYATDPNAFVRVDPLTFVDSLSPSDFQTVVGWRTQALQAGAPKAQERLSITTAMSVSARLLGSAGVKGDKEIGKFQGALMLQMRAYEQAHGNPASEADVMQMARMLLREGSDKPGGRNVVRAYQVNGAFYDRIPDTAERQITQSLSVRLKRAPTHAEVMDYYRRGVEQGLF